MNNSYTVIQSLLTSEKGARQQAASNQYLFAVRKNANKIEIRKAVEEIYKVKVDRVNTSIVPGKLKRVRRELGKTPEWKKAMVTLKEGQKIEIA